MTKTININSKSSPEWYTPLHILKSLGEFDLDPCAPINRKWDTAKKHYTKEDDGLSQDWEGRIWLNPPYGRSIIDLWMEKMSKHIDGIALVFAKTETQWFQKYVFPFADSILWIYGRIKFLDENYIPRKSGAGSSCLIAYTEKDSDIISMSNIGGFQTPLSTSFILIDYSSQTWKSIVGKSIHQLGGQCSAKDLYQKVYHLAPSKCRNNIHYKAKVRQVVQNYFTIQSRGKYAS